MVLLNLPVVQETGSNLSYSAILIKRYLGDVVGDFDSHTDFFLIKDFYSCLSLLYKSSNTFMRIMHSLIEIRFCRK